MTEPNGQSLPLSPDIAADLHRGIGRFLTSIGFSVLEEFKLGNGRRADLAGLSRNGKIIIVEIKSSLADYRSDRKWPDYLDYCDLFYFGIAETFPCDVLNETAALPNRTGIIIGDRFDAGIVRHAKETCLNGTRRRAEILRFARKAAARLHYKTELNGKDGYSV